MQWVLKYKSICWNVEYGVQQYGHGDVYIYLMRNCANETLGIINGRHE